MEDRLVILDVDHTITRHSTGLRLVGCGMAHRLFGLSVLLSIPYHYVRYRRGRIDVDRAAAGLSGLAGMDRGRLEEIAERCFEERIEGDIYPGARKLVEAHREAGDAIVFATSSLGVIVRPLAERLGAHHLIATELEYDEEERATGRLAAPPCLGEEKLARVAALAADLGWNLEGAVFYSDSHLDLPLLERVGRPIAVNPDRALRRIAAERGWEIVRLR